MRTARIPLCLSTVLILAALAGCGGGGSDSPGGAGSITGRISDLIGLPATNRAPGDAIRLSVEGTNLTAAVDADGAFTINGVPAGLQTVTARTTTHAAAFCARVSPGTETKVGDIGLRESGQISGLVTSADNHTPIPSARVTVTELVFENTADVAPRPVRVQRTGASGSYTVDGLPTGEYLVTVSKEGFESESLWTYVSPFSTTAGDLRLHAADPAAKGVMSGTATLVAEDGARTPVAGALVRLVPRGLPEPPMPPTRPLPEQALGAGGGSVDLYPSAGRSHTSRDRYTYTDENGAYSLDGIPAGEYTAAAVRAGLDPEEKPVTITASGVVTVDFQLRLHRPRIGTIEGSVVSETGEPVANAAVRLMPGMIPMPLAVGAAAGTGYLGPAAVGGSGGGAPGSIGGGSGGLYITPDDFDFFATTDAQGRFRMRAPAGEVVVEVWADGFLPRELKVQVPLGGSVSADFRLTKHVAKEVTLSGRVVAQGSNGQQTPVASATVFASPIFDFPHVMGAPAGTGSAASAGESRMHPFMVYQAETDADGRFSLKLQSGVYHLSAMKENHYSEPERAEILEDASREFVVKPYPVTFPPEPTGRRR